MKFELVLTVLLVGISAASENDNYRYSNVPELKVNGKVLDHNSPVTQRLGGLSWYDAYTRIVEFIKNTFHGVSSNGKGDPEFKINCEVLNKPLYPDMKCVCKSITIPHIVVGKACFYQRENQTTTVEPISITPAQSTSKPTTEPTTPAQSTSEPTTEPTTPAQSTSEPTTEPTATLPHLTSTPSSPDPWAISPTASDHHSQCPPCPICRKAPIH